MSHLSNAQVSHLPRPTSPPGATANGAGPRPSSLPLASVAEARAPETVARSLYAELRSTGFSEQQVIALAGELLSLVTADVRNQSQG